VQHGLTVLVALACLGLDPIFEARVRLLPFCELGAPLKLPALITSDQLTPNAHGDPERLA
jgi:hypothetical protein